MRFQFKMKKIGLVFRETLENRINKELEESCGVFIIKYSKLSAPDLTLLRQSLKGGNANLLVAKNSIVRRALLNSKLQGLVKFVDGPCGLVFAKKDAVGASGALYKFSKGHENLKLDCGFLEDSLIDTKGIERLANLAPKEVLRAQVVIALNSPIFGLVFALKQALNKFVICLDKIREKKAG